MGALYKKMGQLEKAAECYQKALGINGHHGETHYNLGLLYEQTGRREPAIYHYQKFIQLSSKTHPDLAAKVQRNLNHLLLAPPSPLSSPPSRGRGGG
jgi:tetratricopeptide (TPR) repeat protein